MWRALLVAFCAVLFSQLDADLTTTIAAMVRPDAAAFNDRVVWITGASSGIGRGLAEEFARQGAKVILSARNQKKPEEVQKGLGVGSRAAVLPLDLEQLDTLPVACATAEKLFGRVDILVNNGGISTRALARETALTVDERLMRVNHLAQVALAKCVLPGMTARREGHIVTVSSVAGKIGANLRSAYSASKFAVLGFFDALRMEELEHGISITNVLPGSVQTDVCKNALDGNGRPLGASDDEIDNGLTVSRTASLVTSAVWMRLDEVWVAKNPQLLFLYLMQYCPTCARGLQKLLAKRMELKTMAAIERNKKATKAKET